MFRLFLFLHVRFPSLCTRWATRDRHPRTAQHSISVNSHRDQRDSTSTMNALTTALQLLAAWSLMAVTVLPAASGYRAVRTSGPLPVTVHVRSGGVVAGGPAANRTAAGGLVFPASVQASPPTTTTSATSAANAAAAAAAGFTSFSTSSSNSNQTGNRNQTRSERLRARLVLIGHNILSVGQVSFKK